MNSKLLRISLMCIGTISFCSAAETISGEVVEDLFFYDTVNLAGVEAPEDTEVTIGTSSVFLSGTGSVTIGARNDGGMLRLIVWGGTNIKSERTWGENDQKVWWSGALASPVRGRATTESLDFAVSGNHVGSQTIALETYALGIENETFEFSPEATLVLPVSVPDLTKVWIATKTGDALGKIGEEDFCIIQGQLCVVDIAIGNEVTLVREKFEDCPDKEVANGAMGQVPYCQISCDRGFVFNESVTGCVASDDESAIEIFETDDVDVEGATVKRTGQSALLAGPARQGYIRFTGSNAQREPIDTSEMSGEELRAALRWNAAVVSRNTKGKEDTDDGAIVASLKRQLNDVRGTLWSWENPISPEGGEEGEVYSAQAEGSEEGGTAHASAPLLPSTGPAGIFVGIAALGFGLMAFSRRRRR